MQGQTHYEVRKRLERAQKRHVKAKEEYDRVKGDYHTNWGQSERRKMEDIALEIRILKWVLGERKTE